MSRATYLNGSKWADLGPKPDLRFLYLLMAIAMVVCGACGAAHAQSVSGGSSGSSGGGNAVPGYLNFNSALLPFTQRCLSNVRNGKGNCLFLAVGDSTTWGQGAGTGGSQITNAYYLSYPTDLANALGSAGITAHQDCVLGSQWGGGTDNRLTLNSWANTASGAFNTMGGSAWYNNSDTTSWIFTPNGPVDTFDVYTNSQASGGATVTINIDGGSTLATVNTQTGTQDIVKTTVTISGAGTHQVRVQRTGAGTLAAIIGANAYNSTVPGQVHVCNAGWVGARTSSWSDTSEGNAAPLNSIPRVRADLMLLNLGINDMINSVALATSVANTTAIIAAQTQPTTFLAATNTGIAGTQINFANVPPTVGYGEIVYDATSAVVLGKVTAVTLGNSGNVTIDTASNWSPADTITFTGPGDTILIVPTPVQTSVASAAVQAAYANGMAGVAGTTIPYVNLQTFFGSWNQNQAAGMQWDSYHPNGQGYAKAAQSIMPIIAQTGGL